MKKSVKFRGNRVQGKGRKRKIRGKGNRGGRGLSGTKKHRKTWVNAKKPGHLGKRGFINKTRKQSSILNVGELDYISGGKREIDLTAMGYEKLLGSGRIGKAMTVKIPYCSARAAEKIESAKGRVEGNITDREAE